MIPSTPAHAGRTKVQKPKPLILVWFEGLFDWLFHRVGDNEDEKILSNIAQRMIMMENSRTDDPEEKLALFQRVYAEYPSSPVHRMGIRNGWIYYKPRSCKFDE